MAFNRFAGASWWFLGIATWLAGVVAGFGLLLEYKSEPGVTRPAPTVWPKESALRPGSDRATLLMFLHPRCACSRASLAELERLLGRVNGRVSTKVVLVKPRGTEPGWEQGSTRRAALATAGAEVVEDKDGVEATRFGAETSGASVLYDRSGRLRFEGGITALRGHEGTSFGQERIVSLITKGTADRHDSPVFGCGLRDPLEVTLEDPRQ